MDDERLELLKSEVEDGSLRRGFLFVSRSRYWLPWMVGSATDRIEIGLFSEYMADPDGPAFAIDWRTTSDGVGVEVRASAEAWQVLPHLTGLDDLIRELAASSSGASMSADEFALKLQAQGYAESLWAKHEEDELPLPPPEPLPEDIGFFGDATGKPAPDEPTWVGPHIGRTARFLNSLDRFVGELLMEGVPALDIKAGYVDSAFHRLWEGMDYSIIDDRLLAKSGRDDVLDVPYAVTDTHAYLVTAFREAENAMRRCGIADSGGTATLIEPISEVQFQLWQTTPEDFDRLQTSFQAAGARTGLRVIWDDERPSVGLPDNDDYRPHGPNP